MKARALIGWLALVLVVASVFAPVCSAQCAGPGPLPVLTAASMSCCEHCAPAGSGHANAVSCTHEEAWGAPVKGYEVRHLVSWPPHGGPVTPSQIILSAQTAARKNGLAMTATAGQMQARAQLRL